MTQESSPSVESEGSTAQTGPIAQVVDFFQQNTWVLYVFGVVFGFAVVGLGLDALAGPLTPGTELVHQIAGLFAASSAVLFVALATILLIWIALIVKESRVR